MQLWSKTVRHSLISHVALFAMCLAQGILPVWANDKTNVAAGNARLAIFDTVTGTITGSVIDANGAGIPQVTVRVTNIDTGNTRAVRTDANGDYAIAALPHGIYRIEVSKDGLVLLPTENNKSLELKTRLNSVATRIPAIVMGPPSAIQPPVAVTPAPGTPVPTPIPAATNEAALGGQLTNQNDATRSANIEEKLLLAIPLADGRTFDTVANLAAGVAPPPHVRGVSGPGIGSGIGTAGQFAVNGQRARSNNFTVDGSDNNDEDVGVRRQGFTALVPQSIESVREVQIVTHLWDAEAGRNVGSQVNAVSQSGTNRVHGTLYEFFNHDSLNARNFFDYSTGNTPTYALTATAYSGFVNGVGVNPQVRPVVLRNGTLDTVLRPVVQANPSLGKDPFQRNQGGGVIGFPLKKDRTFFFGSYERQDVKARQETHFAVPTIAQRGFLNFGASGYRLNINNRVQDHVPGTIVGDAAFSLFPFPNNPVGPYGGNTFTQVLAADGAATIFSTKLDHSFKAWGREHTLTGRYNFTNDERIVPAVGGALFSSLIPFVGTQNLSLFLNSQLSPTLANQVRVSFGRTRLRFTEKRDPFLRPSRFTPNEPFLLSAPVIDNLTQVSPPANLAGVTNLIATPRVADEHIGTAGQLIITPFSPVGADVNLFPQARANNTIQAADTLTKFATSHTLKLGFDLRRTQLNSLLNRNYRPQIVFSGGPDLTSRFADATILNPSQFGPTPGYFSGTDLAALGIPTGISQALAIGNPDSTIALRFWQLDFFANDNWQARRGLTFDFGLRYELNTVPREANNRIERTFGLDQLPANDPNLRLLAPFSNPARLYDSARLLGALNKTLTAYRQILGGRETIYDADRNNLSPRFSVAWDPFAGSKTQAGKTVIRAGVGMYYDVNLGSVVSQSRNVFPTFLPYNVDANTFFYARNEFLDDNGDVGGIFNPVYVPVFVVTGNQFQRYPLVTASKLNSIQLPSGIIQQTLGLLFDPTIGGGRPSGGGLAFTLPARDLRAPYTLQYNLQVERELAKNWLLNAAYVGTRGLKLTRFRTPNGGPNSITIPIDPLALNANPVTAIALPPLGNLNSNAPTRLNDALGAYTIFDSSAASTYHALQASLTKRFSRGWQFSAAYTYAHALDDVSDVFDIGGAFALPQDDRNFAAERASANFDIRHRLVWSLVANVPGLHRLNDRGGAAGWLFGNWQFSALTTLQTGQPYTVNTSFDVNLDGNLTDRINTLTGLRILNDGRARLALADTGTKLLAPLGQNGSIGRNTFRAAGVAKTDVALFKNFRLRGDHQLLLRAEAFNLLNRTHFAIPVRILEAPSFGSATETSVNPRQIQFALKYIF